MLLRAVGLHSNDLANITSRENNAQFKERENVLRNGFLSVKRVNRILMVLFGIHFRALNDKVRYSNQQNAQYCNIYLYS